MWYIVAAIWKNRIIPEGLFTLAIFLRKRLRLCPVVFSIFSQLPKVGKTSRLVLSQAVSRGGFAEKLRQWKYRLTCVSKSAVVYTRAFCTRQSQRLPKRLFY